ncbi:hypothetical protein ABI_08630 [Asticcacaulis biprosthecium C19]|uniref:Uncharacterized protein n=1 Tax=Asticcacaulis biprosthecium C19 TaxID=715226 RepID=F4QG99_9CAUL|nr:phage protein Gp36 family protein [Asticcacaulis biprosthecium]EGF92427.1 hypothetical protein ABI_08630 [Asticcacaulis biprosthecium C19]
MYATASQILERAAPAELAELEKRTGVAVDLAYVETLAREAAAEIDAHLVELYELPFADPLPTTLKPATIDLVLERLFGGEGPSSYRLKAEGTRTFLRQVKTGALKLVGRTYRRKAR